MATKISKSAVFGIIGILIILVVWFIIMLSLPGASTPPRPVTNLEEVFK
ncbi:MAG: hypothetical protein K6U80_15980 [Firmicutes bacterium]|nr:hypothetical protein [Bacillota bacterium]